jgi:hypothetical protein
MKFFRAFDCSIGGKFSSSFDCSIGGKFSSSFDFPSYLNSHNWLEYQKG